MHEQLQRRLEELRTEWATGQAQLQELERQQVYLRETLLRISGAIQVLEEVLAAKDGEGADDTPGPGNPLPGVQTG